MTQALKKETTATTTSAATGHQKEKPSSVISGINSPFSLVLPYAPIVAVTVSLQGPVLPRVLTQRSM